MEKFATENLIRMELLVNRIHFEHTVGRDLATLDGDTCVSFQFLDNGPLLVRDANFTTNCPGDKNGRSCLFFLTPKQCGQALKHFDVLLQVFKRMNSCVTEKMIFGESLVSVSNLFKELMNAVRAGKINCAKTLKGCYMLNSSSGEVVGNISVYIKLSCYGKLVVNMDKCAEAKERKKKDKCRNQNCFVESCKPPPSEPVDGFGEESSGYSTLLDCPPPSCCSVPPTCPQSECFQPPSCCSCGSCSSCRTKSPTCYPSCQFPTWYSTPSCTPRSSYSEPPPPTSPICYPTPSSCRPKSCKPSTPSCYPKPECPPCSPPPSCSRPGSCKPSTCYTPTSCYSEPPSPPTSPSPQPSVCTTSGYCTSRVSSRQSSCEYPSSLQQIKMLMGESGGMANKKVKGKGRVRFYSPLPCCSNTRSNSCTPPYCHPPQPCSQPPDCCMAQPHQPPVSCPTQPCSQLPVSCPTQPCLQPPVSCSTQTYSQPPDSCPTQPCRQPPVSCSTQPKVRRPAQRYSQPPAQPCYQSTQPYPQPPVYYPAQPRCQSSVCYPAQPCLQPPVCTPAQPYSQPCYQPSVSCSTQPCFQPPAHQTLVMRTGCSNWNSSPFSFKLGGGGCQCGGNNICINPTTCTTKDGTKFTEISDPSKKMFVLRIGKKNGATQMKNNVDLELCTPTPCPPPPSLDSKRIQVDMGKDGEKKKKGGGKRNIVGKTNQKKTGAGSASRGGGGGGGGGGDGGGGCGVYTGKPKPCNRRQPCNQRALCQQSAFLL